MRVRNAARAMLASLLWISVASAQGTTTGGAPAKTPAAAASATAGGSVALPGAASASADAKSAKAPAAAASATATTQSATAAPATAGASTTPAAPSSAPAAGAAPTTTAAATGAAAGAAPMDGSTYAVRLRDLESRVDELKEQIRRSHTRLSLLSDTILSAGVGGARAEIRFQNDMSSAFRLTRALFVLDGAVQYNKADDTGALA